MERYTLKKGVQRRLPKEETFKLIDNKLENVRKRLPANNQIDMEEFYMIFTRSNELIHVVDCRTQEEYDSCHICKAITYVYVC